MQIFVMFDVPIFVEDVATVLEGELFVGFQTIESWNGRVLRFKVEEVDGIGECSKAGSDRHLIHNRLTAKDAINIGALIV